MNSIQKVYFLKEVGWLSSVTTTWFSSGLSFSPRFSIQKNPVFNANTTQDERDSDPQGNDDEQEEVYSNDDDDEGDYWAIWTLVVVVRCTQNVLD